MQQIPSLQIDLLTPITYKGFKCAHKHEICFVCNKIIFIGIFQIVNNHIVKFQ